MLRIGENTGALDVAALDYAAPRDTIVMTALDFPSDVYALRSQILLHGGDPARHGGDHLAGGRPSVVGEVSEEDEELVPAKTEGEAVFADRRFERGGNAP